LSYVCLLDVVPVSLTIPSLTCLGLGRLSRSVGQGQEAIPLHKRQAILEALTLERGQALDRV